MKFAFATAILKIETSRMRRRFARVCLATRVGTNLVPRAHVSFGQRQDTESYCVGSCGGGEGEPGEPGYEFVEHLEE